MNNSLCDDCVVARCLQGLLLLSGSLRRTGTHNHDEYDETASPNNRAILCTALPRRQPSVLCFAAEDQPRVSPVNFNHDRAKQRLARHPRHFTY